MDLNLQKKAFLLAAAGIFYLTGCGSGTSDVKNELVGGWDGNCLKRDFSYKSILQVSNLNILEQRKVYDSDDCDEETLYAEQLYTYSYTAGEPVQDNMGNSAKSIDLTLEESSTLIIGEDDEPRISEGGATYYRMYKLEGDTLYLSNPDMVNDNFGDTPETRETAFDEGILFIKV